MSFLVLFCLLVIALTANSGGVSSTVFSFIEFLGWKRCLVFENLFSAFQVPGPLSW